MAQTKTTIINFTLLNCIFIILFLALTGALLYQSNSMVYYGLEIDKNNDMLQDLLIQNEYLTKKIVSFNSMENISYVSKNLDMVKVEKFDYIALNQEVFAQK
ncbi:hypothetical protein ISS06_00320 [Patescibacteria group bacterium]|nr:hypothetical protein [Patescibacteria group bacterium]